ncbi:MAG: hypothetical protein HC842_03205, partial [Cytophagales bacterium]|nr:hypothetical protein [Cytophagales bacterium]
MKNVRLLFCVVVLWLFASASAQAGLIQTIDYETGDLSQVYSEVDGSNAYVQASTERARAGSYSLKSYMTTSDRRAETVNKYGRGTVGGVNWYGWSVYIPANHPGDGRFDIVSQFHDYHGTQPSWSKDNKAPTHLMVKGENAGTLQFDLKYQSGAQQVAHQVWNLGSYSLGAWHDVVMQVKWTHNGDG